MRRSEKEPLWPLNHSSLSRIEDDLVMVDAINQGLMVHNLRERYRRDKIYTWVGANHSVLVSINPFKMLPIYSPATIEEYAKPSAYRLDPPHTFAIANSAFMKLTQENSSQVLRVSLCDVDWLEVLLRFLIGRSYGGVCLEGFIF